MAKDATEAMLRDVSVVSRNDVWVVGRWTGAGRRTLAAHWDGLSWTRAPTPDSPDSSTGYNINSVDAAASDDVWAVGGDQELTSPNNATPLFLHYDGIAWSEVPPPSGVDGELSDVDLLSGERGLGRRDQPETFRSSCAAPPAAGSRCPYPHSGRRLAPVGLCHVPNDAWAVGSQELRQRA